jgi:glycosyltransferase involved in cell wall biosynthesis
VRILQISSARTFGGGERHLIDLCRGLTGKGHEVFVALRPTTEWQRYLDFLPSENIFHVSIRNSFGVLSAIKISEFVKERKVQIVHAHVARDYIPASIACMTAGNAKFVLTRHMLQPLKPFNRFALKNLAAAIGVSDTVGVGLKQLFPPSKVTIIHNGLDVGEPPNAAAAGREFREFHEIPLDVPLIGTLGELKEAKGQRDFVLAAAEIAKAVPDAWFVVAGEENSARRQFRRELRRLAVVLGLHKRFVWLDWLADTAPFHAAVDVFVAPSHNESFGLAVLEAMARGKAIVTTETEGAKQLFGRDGNIVPIMDPVAIANAVSELLRDDERRTAAGERARQLAADKFSLRRMVDETEKLYERVLG